MQRTTATRLLSCPLFVAGWVTALVLASLPDAAAESGKNSFGLFLDRVEVFAPIDRSKVAQTCGVDRLCAARRIVETLGPPAQLEAVVHPDTDSIRRATSQPSIGRFQSIGPGVYILRMDRFGRKLNDEILFNIRSINSLSHLIIDLRGNRGGAFDRMRRAAALFTGPIAAALETTHRGTTRKFDIPPPKRRLTVPRLSVLIGPRTASSAEILAALLRQHANAVLLGTRSFGKDYLYRIIPVTSDWRLLLPAERISVPGQTIADGVIPDGPVPVDMAHRIE